MNCNKCNNQMTSGVYRCSTNTYDICDINGNVLYTWALHDIPIDNPEIGTKSDVHYCLDCHILVM